MSTLDSESGIALVCAPEGSIVRWIRDEFGLGDGASGRDFFSLVDEASSGKARAFLAGIVEHGAAFNWELNLPIAGRIESLHFAGGATLEGLLIVGAPSRGRVVRFYEELMRINNEQANALRSATRDLAVRARETAEQDIHIYEELSRVNNELVNVQRELTKKNAELEGLNARINQFIGMAAHDLRNPLGNIRTFSQFLLEDAADVLKPVQLGLMRKIERSSEVMLHLVNDLLESTKLAAGQLDLDLADVDLALLMDRNVSLNLPLAEKKQIGLEFRPEAELPRVLIDAFKIDQVLNNLIGNAIKFSHPGSTIEVLLTRSGNGVIIAVRDHGQGIPEAELDRVFEPFQRTSVRSTAGEKSTGLGLAIARHIVEGHHGRIWAESKLGEGTTFYVLLPLNKA